jgi:hypothetical protein
MKMTDAMLAAGWANGDGKFVEVGLRKWMKLACRVGDVSDPYWAGDESVEEMSLAYASLMGASPRTTEEILSWANCVMQLAQEWEHNPPIASAKWDKTMGDGVLRLSWDGTFNSERWFVLFVWDTEEGLAGRMEWNTGTGRPSRFLAMDQTLAEAGVLDQGES